MKLLTEDAVLRCGHNARVLIVPTQTLVFVERRQVLVSDNPENRPISMCPNIGATIKPCTKSREVQRGYSAFVRVQGHAVCMDTVTGLTDGTPPDSVFYTVRDPGQTLVESLA